MARRDRVVPIVWARRDRELKRLKATDVVIVGSGFSGLVMAKEITSKSGLNVVVLERGPARSLAKYVEDMDDIATMRVGMVQNAAEQTITLRHTNKDTAVPIRQYGSFHPGTGTGGASEAWQGIAGRFPPDHMVLASHLREKFGASRLPKDWTIRDWGITYDEFEDYYWRAEEFMGVSGKAGNLNGKLMPGGNIFEGPRKHEFPNPPLIPTYTTTFFYKAALALGYHPYPMASGIASQDYTNPYGVSRPGCFYSGFCPNHGCKSGAKAMPSSTLLPALVNEKNFTLRNNSWVRKIVHRDGHAEGVIYMDEKGEETMQPADLVIVAAWTPNSVRLLYLSGIGDPYDPETRKGTLGMNLTHQIGAGGGGILVHDEPLNLFMSTGAAGYAVSDLDQDLPEDVPEGVLRGGIFEGGAIQNYSAISGFGRIPPGAAARNWGSEWKKAAVTYWDRIVTGVGMEPDTFPYRQNYMDLDPTYTDKWGDPLLRFTLDFTEYEQRQFAYGARLCDQFTRKIAEISKAKLIPVGMDDDGSRDGGGGFRHYNGVRYQTTHIQGGAIMGASPDQSALNTWLQHWKMPNLFVVGSNALPQTSGTHPTTTIVALAYRAADGVTDHYLKRPGLIG
jgi:gluconate 2-dehydrogenase alpha chain